MRGVILAGGHGKRLDPLTRVTNKHLLPVGNKPMIMHPIGKLVEAGVKDIVLITGRDDMGNIMSLLGSGTEYGCSLTYRVQDEAGGIAEAMGLCEDFCKAEQKLVVMLADNIFDSSLVPFVKSYASSTSAMILVTKSDTPSRFGVVEMDDKGKVLSIEEKPSRPKSNWIQTGIYFYNLDVFDVVKKLKRSDRGELEVTDVNNHYLRAGTLDARKLPGKWVDAGTFESLAEANRMMRCQT